MERRAYTRQLLQLKAKLVRPGIDEAHCTLRDFCPGGVFVEFANEGGGGDLEANDSVQIQFNLPVQGVARDFRLRARIAGMFKSGAGCEFFDPDPQALAALHAVAAATAASTMPPPTPSTPKSTRADAKELIDRVKFLFSNYLEARIDPLFKQAEERLFIAARDAKSNDEQNVFFDTLKSVNRLKPPVRSSFFEVAVAHMDRLGEPLEAMHEPQEEGTFSALSLVESGEFADWLKLKQIMSRAEPKLRDDLFKIEGRFSELVGKRVEDDNNPVGLAGLCHTFHDALQTVPSPRGARSAVFDAFDDTMIADLPSFYRKINQLLEEAGVLPGLERPKPVIPKSEGTAEPKGQRPAPHADAEPARVDPFADDVWQRTPDIAGHPHPRSGPTTGRVTTDSPAGLQRADVFSGAHHPGRPSLASHPSASPAMAPAPAVRAPQAPIHGALAARPPLGASPSDLGGPATDALPWEEQIAELQPHASLLGGIPFDRHRAVTGHVYQSPVELSGAYQTAQALLGLRREIVPHNEGGPPANEPIATYDPEQVEGAIALLQRQEVSIEPPLQGGPDLRTRVIRSLRSRHGYADKREIPEQEANAIDVVERLLGSVLEDPLVAQEVKPFIRKLETALLNAALRDPAFFSAPTHTARRFVDGLAKLKSIGEPEQSALSSLVHEVASYSVDDPSVFGRSSHRLEALLARQEHSRAENVKQVVAQCKQEQALKKARVGGSSGAPDEREFPEEWKQWLARAKRLRVGDAVLLDKDTASPQRTALAWVGADYSTYVFVDDQGLKAATLSLPELAMQLRRGSADVLSEAELPAMERGLYSMLGRMHEEVVHRAARDDLTGLVNAKEFELALTSALASARDDTNHVACLIDMDRFHVINDTCGRVAAERLLKEIGGVLRKTLGRAGTLARLAEDEFAVLLENETVERAVEKAEQQRRAVEAFRVKWKGERLSVTATIGLSALTATSLSPERVMEAARRALEIGKQAGGNRIEVASGVSESIQDWESRIEGILASGCLELRCQKIVKLSEVEAGKPHYEVLLGPLAEGGRSISPGELIEAAQRCDRIRALDRCVIEQTFAWMSAHKRHLTKLGGLSINLSGQSLSDDDTLDFVLGQFTESRLPPGKVLFEVAESAAINSLSNAENFIRVLKEYGCRFSLDDFGSGSSSYSYLKHLPVDFVKIDGMFVKEIARNANDRATVKSINEIGHFMGKQTVAEHAESGEILDVLREIGVDYAQGNAVEESRPLRELA